MQIILMVVLALGGFLSVAGTTIAVVGGIGLIFTKTAGSAKGFISTIKGIPSVLGMIQIYGLYAGDAVKAGLGKIRSAGSTVATAVRDAGSSLLTMVKGAVIPGVAAAKNMALNLAGMAKQAIMTAVTAMPGFIASVWSFTVALFANPITWIILAIVALIAILVLLWQNWDSVTAFL